MSWWRRSDPEPESAVPDEVREDLDVTRGELDATRGRINELAGEARRGGGFLRRERDEVNHLAERVRQALTGLS